MLGKGVFHVIDFLAISSAIKDDGDTCVQVGRVDADDFLIFGSLAGLFFWLTMLTLDVSFFVAVTLHRMGLDHHERRNPRWYDAFMCGVDSFRDSDNPVETVKGQDNIVGVESIAMVFLSALAIYIYVEMDASCQSGKLGIITLIWVFTKLLYVALVAGFVFRKRRSALEDAYALTHPGS